MDAETREPVAARLRKSASVDRRSTEGAATLLTGNCGQEKRKHCKY
jgi:hypothetical protein